MSGNTAGDRWEKFLDICNRVKQNEHKFKDNQIDFCHTTASRLEQYGSETFMSTAQVNWLNRLEQELERHGL